VMVANTDTLIYTDPNTDPYTNNNLGNMLGENQDLCDSLIGSANYDVGHVFGTAGGGLAGVGVVCGGVKAWGATGLSSPVGDFFSVDYASHEFGHQFSGGHTFNECGGPAGDPYEPGSGVTIMAYAGLCGASNLQPNSVDQFHVNTYDEVIFYTQTANGNSCPMITNTGNTPPIVTVPAGGFYIPFQTPFELIGSATDLDGDSLTYCWEQFDLGPSVHPDSASGTAPLFRTWHATPDPVRICPRIEDLVTNTHTIGELLPQFGREMNFRLSVRDNKPGGGGADNAQMTFQVADSAGPFQIVSPNGGQLWTAGDVETVTWDVANTDMAPVNCNSVDIFMSTDGGWTYPHVLATNRPNTGSAAITVPNLPGNMVRVQVHAGDNIFFDVSNGNSSIFPPSAPDFSVTVNAPVQTLCGQDSATYDIDLDTLMGYNDPVTLSLFGMPNGLAHSFSANPTTPPSTVQLMVWDTASIVPGNYTLTLQANGSSGIKNLPLTLQVRSGAPGAVSLISPFNGAANITGNSPLTWNAIPFVSSYTIEIAETPTFSPVAQTASGITGTSYTPFPDLNNNTIYFWRVRADASDCGPGPWSSTFSFQTVLSQCVTIMSVDTPLSISGSGTPTVYSELVVTQNLVLTDVNVVEFWGTHTWISHMNLRLISPYGDSIPLWGNICGSDDNWNLELDDQALQTNIPCPPTTGQTYTPNSTLSILNGNNATGTWKMECFDDTNQDGGTLQSWGLEMCGPPVSQDVPNLALTGGSVSQGDTLLIDNTLLDGDCSPSANTLSYTLTALPQNGTLYLNGVALAVGDDFTQDDIDQGLLTYVHNGQSAAPDQFEFIVHCPNAGYTGGLVFPITVIPVLNVEAPSGLAFKLYPNPSAGAFKLEIGPEAGDALAFRLVDLTGRIVRFEQVQTGITAIDVQDLPAGMYSGQVL
ncbi:MAG: reprolysin-like metallopeptidase, partial [Bacteroidota bacterium]